ncbi:MAG: DUF3124 domain-containing protein [Ardenticatenales bacterium]|nr:DUF3124 domain-containing protein [Ardenticatenales bacterium]
MPADERYAHVALDSLTPVTGQTVYVPAYSEIYFGDRQRTIELAITLAIHNASPDAPIVLSAVRYHNNEGELVTEYVDEPLLLPPLATASYVIDRQDRSGGVGANFIVEWRAESEVPAPVVEAVMVAPESQHGISVLSVGRVIREFSAEPAE